MLSLFSLATPTIVFLALCNSVVGRPGVSRPRNLLNVLEPRKICYEDDTLLSFQYWIIDSEPYCSSLLGIVDTTETSTATSRTTGRTLSTNLHIVAATTTIPSVTVLSTPFGAGLVAKRAAPTTTSGPNFYQANPYAYPVYAGDADASIASSYYSACDCLNLQTGTAVSVSTVKSTRTISGIDYEESTSLIPFLYGTTTILLSRQASTTTSTTSSLSRSPISPILPPIVSTLTPSLLPSSTGRNTSLFLSSGTLSTRPPLITAPSSGLPPISSANITISSLRPSLTFPPSTSGNLSSTRASSSLPTVSSNFTSTRPATSGFPTVSLNLTTSVPASLTLPPLSINITRPATSGFPTPSVNLSSSISASSRLPLLSINSTSSASSRIPTPSINSTSPSLTLPSISINSTRLATSGFPTPSINITSRPASLILPSLSFNSTSIRPATSGFPTLSANVTSASLTLPSPSINSTRPASTGFITLPTNTSIPFSFTYPTSLLPTSTTSKPSTSTTSAVPSATPTLDINNCPVINSTVIALADGQTFQVLCNTEFGGPVDIGLNEPDFRDCIQQCGTANNGFSAVRCRGVTYYPSADGVNCYFKNLANLQDEDENPDALSAVLIQLPLLNTTISPVAAATSAAPSFLSTAPL